MKQLNSFSETASRLLRRNSFRPLFVSCSLSALVHSIYDRQSGYFKPENWLSFLGLISGEDPDVQSCSERADFADGIVGVGVGNADLPGLLDYFEGGVVLDPTELGAEEMFAREKLF